MLAEWSMIVAADQFKEFRDLIDEGSLTTFMKRLIRLDSLGAYAQARGVGTLTTESPWDSPEPRRPRARARCCRARGVRDAARGARRAILIGVVTA
jgi:hypothetical protein